MAYAKKTSKANEAFQKLKNDISAGTIGCGYLFYGEESYLREYYLGELRKKLVPAGFEEFNYHRMEGKELTVQTLSEMAEAMPMLAELCLPYVKPGGLFLAMKSNKTDEEIAGAEKIIQALGGEKPFVMDYLVPGTEVYHRVVTVFKARPTPGSYPRKWTKIKETKV